MRATAVESWSEGTRLRIAACSAVLNRALAAAPAITTTRTITRLAVPATTAHPRTVYAAMRSTSQTIISRRRSRRSASTPAGSRQTRVTSRPVVPTRPACAGDPVNWSTSRGRARLAMALPRSERHWPAQSRLKSRLRHRLGGRPLSVRAAFVPVGPIMSSRSCGGWGSGRVRRHREGTAARLIAATTSRARAAGRPAIRRPGRGGPGTAGPPGGHRGPAASAG